MDEIARRRGGLRPWTRRGPVLLLLVLLLIVVGLVHASLVAAQTAGSGATGCETSAAATMAWQSTEGRDHPLVGAVLDTAVGATMPWPVFASVFADKLARASPAILLGEVHDNPDHHAQRAALIGRSACARAGDPLSGAASPGAAVFEHIRADQQLALDTFAAVASSKTADLMRLLDWDNGGWPSQRMFAPLFDAVIAARWPILAGDPPRRQVRALARGEAGAVPTDERARLRLDEALPPALRDALSAELKGSHCGMLPDAAITGLAAAQQYRDAHLADAMLAAAEKHGAAVLLAGNGHVRSDRGVPWHIRQRAPGRQILTVMFVEVEDGVTDARAYVPRAPDDTPAADFVIFTPRASRSDPCEQMRSMKAGRG